MVLLSEIFNSYISRIKMICIHLIIFPIALVLLKFGNYVKSDYIDVAEMGFKIRDKVNSIKHETVDSESNCECLQDPIHCDMLNRFVNKIPLAALVRAENEEYIDIKIKFGVGELKILKEFTQGSCQTNNEAYRIMNNAIRKMEIITNTNQVNWTMLIYEFLNHNQEMLVFVSIILFIFLLLIWWWTLSKSWNQVFLKGFVLLLITGSVWNWMRMYKDAKAGKIAMMEKAKGEIPLACRPKDMGLWDHLVQWYKGSFTFSEDECRSYYKHFTVDVFWDTNPLTAVSDILSRMTLHPLSVIGEYIARFIRELFSRLPLQYALPVGVFMCFAMFFCLIACFNYRIRLPFFFVMEPVLPPPPPPPHQIQNQPIPQQNFYIQPIPPQPLNQINEPPQLPVQLQEENIHQNDCLKLNKSQTQNMSDETTFKDIVTKRESIKESLQECIPEKLVTEKIEKIEENQTTVPVELNEKKGSEKILDHQSLQTNNCLLLNDQLIPPGNKISNL